MRVVSLIAAAAATAPLAVSAAGTLGYALGARHPGKRVFILGTKILKAKLLLRWDV